LTTSADEVAKKSGTMLVKGCRAIGGMVGVASVETKSAKPTNVGSDEGQIWIEQRK
jgi:hypothetical protein